jgi:hypothetical protein
LEYSLDTGMEDLYRRLKKINFSAADFDGERFVRLRLLQKHLSLVEA